jgi:hypothetical protein
MSDQETGGAPAPVVDANAPTTETKVETPVSEADPSTAATDPGEAPAKPKESDARDERIKELTRHRREAERRADRLARELDEVRRAPRAQPQQQPNAQPSNNATDVSELARQEAKQLLQEQAKAERREQFDSRVDEYASEIEDYDDVVTSRTPVSEHMGEAIMDSDIPGQVLYYLGKNPEVARKLYSLPLTKAAKEIGRIEDRLLAERKKAAEKPVSKAPPPAPQIDAKEPSTRVSTTSPDSDALSDEEWVKAEQARLRRKAKSRAD